MTDQNAQEPTMEEILASIRRIISEDDAPAETADAPAAATPEAEPVVADPEPEPVAVVAETVEVAVEPEPAPEPTPEPAEDVLELTETYAPAAESIGDLDVSTPEPDPFPEVAPEPAPMVADVSSTVVAAVGGGVTVEALVRSIVEPQVKDWLEQNLDGLLRDMLRERLERVFR